MDINEIKYGNPTTRNAFYINEDSSFDSFLETFNQESFAPPKNASMTTLNELVELGMIDKIQNQEDFMYHSLIDADLPQFIVMQLENYGIRANYNNINNITLDLNPLIMKIKMHFQRPRPFQLAYYRGLNLYPQLSISANTPSYPSGHALQSYFICKLYTYKYKSKKSDFLAISDQVFESRKIMGVHYQSDNQFSKQIGGIL